jgi:serine O-acetyltransferase
MPFSFDHKLGKRILSIIQKYNHKKYWLRRQKVIDPAYKNKILKLYYLYYIKKIDAYHNCSFGTNYNSGTIFKTPPNLPHGPKNIIVGHDLTIGENVTIFHNVTLEHGGSIVGNNVLFSTGSVLLSGRNIGDFSKIGANAIVVENIPDNATVILNKPQIIINQKSI